MALIYKQKNISLLQDVDSVFDKTSSNPIENKVVANAISNIEDRGYIISKRLDNTSLNNITNNGVYFVSGNTCTELPITSSGYLHVISHDTDTTLWVMQLFVGGTWNVGESFIRCCYNGTWKDWNKIYTTGNKPKASDVGAMEKSPALTEFGGNDNTITTSEFIELLKEKGAFGKGYWVTRGTWFYANNQIITDTSCGNIPLAGSVVEVFSANNTEYTIRITTPTTSGLDTSATSSEFIYVNNGAEYSPSWRRQYSTSYRPTPTQIGAIPRDGATNPTIHVAGVEYTLYHTGNKPTASDIGAIATSSCPIVEQSVSLSAPWSGKIYFARVGLIKCIYMDTISTTSSGASTTICNIPSDYCPSHNTVSFFGYASSHTNKITRFKVQPYGRLEIEGSPASGEAFCANIVYV